MMNEADTCRKFVLPKLLAAGWENDPHSIAEQRTITDGNIVAHLDALQAQEDALLLSVLDRAFNGDL